MLMENEAPFSHLLTPAPALSLLNPLERAERENLLKPRISSSHPYMYSSLSSKARCLFVYVLGGVGWELVKKPRGELPVPRGMPLKVEKRRSVDQKVVAGSGVTELWGRHLEALGGSGRASWRRWGSQAGLRR